MDSDSMRRGVVPGVLAGYSFLAFMGAGGWLTSATLGEDGVLSTTMSGGMLGMVGGMIGADALIGFILHIIISAVIGALYTGLFMQYVDLGNPLMNIVVGGLIYGVVWWIIGGLIIMPAIAGGDLLQIDLNSPSLFGHIIFGHSLAFIVVIRDAALGMGGDN